MDRFRKRRPALVMGSWALRMGAAASAVLLGLLLAVMIGRSARFFRPDSVSVAGMLFREDWYPSGGRFGGRAFLGATLRTAGTAVLFATPGSLSLAMFLSDFASDGMRRRFNAILGVLTAIPAVAYGLFALMFITPFLQRLFGHHRVQSFNTLSAALMLGVFIMPTITARMAASLSGTRAGIRQAALALGATPTETVLRIVIPDAWPGLVSAVILGFSRAAGEAVIVGMAAGSGPRSGAGLFESAETAAGFLLRTGSGGSDVVFAFGTVLFLLTLGLNAMGDRLAGLSVVEELR